jgi:hypothetical protein
MEGKPLLRRFWQKLAPHRPAILIIDEQIRDLYINQRTTFYASILFEYLSRIVGSFEFYFILKALGYHPTFLEALYINAATSFILNMLFFVPFELGTREGGMFLVLQSIGYTQGIGIFLGLVTRLREFFWIAIGMAAMLKSEAKPETEKSILTMIEREERP